MSTENDPKLWTLEGLADAIEESQGKMGMEVEVGPHPARLGLPAAAVYLAQRTRAASPGPLQVQVRNRRTLGGCQRRSGLAPRVPACRCRTRSQARPALCAPPQVPVQLRPHPRH